MTAEQNKLLVRRLVEEAVNPGNPEVLDEIARGEFAAAARRWRSRPPVTATTLITGRCATRSSSEPRRMRCLRLGLT